MLLQGRYRAGSPARWGRRAHSVAMLARRLCHATWAIILWLIILSLVLMLITTQLAKLAIAAEWLRASTRARMGP